MKTNEESAASLWRQPLALFGGQWRPLVILNLAWAVQMLPLMLAQLQPAWPFWLRILLSLYSVLAIIPASGAMYAALEQVYQGRPLTPAVMMGSLKEQFVNSYLRLLPLDSLFFWLALAGLQVSGKNLPFESLLILLVMLILGILSLYWGSVMVNVAELSAIGIFIASYKLAWSRKGRTLLAGLLCLLVLGLGLASVIGFLLAAPALAGLIQIHLFHTVSTRK